MKKIAFVLPKAWVNPFGKMPFLGLWKSAVLIVKKASFLSRTSLNLISSSLWTENRENKIALFDQSMG